MLKKLMAMTKAELKSTNQAIDATAVKGRALRPALTHLSPVISIEQKSTNRNPRSTVGTVTEIYDFLRLLYARTADAFSYNTGKKMVRFTEEQMLENLLQHQNGKKLLVLAAFGTQTKRSLARIV